MNKIFKLSGAVVLAATLAACGGGNSDDPSPSEQTGILTVTNASIDGVNGIYGNGALNLTDVEKKNPVGSDPEVCTFKFDGANRVGADGTAYGDVRYRPDATTLYVIFLTVNGVEYSSGQPDNSAVVRDSDRIRLSAKSLTAGNGSTIRVSGVIPMRPSRPTGC